MRKSEMIMIFTAYNILLEKNEKTELGDVIKLLDSKRINVSDKTNKNYNKRGKEK